MEISVKDVIQMLMDVLNVILQELINVIHVKTENISKKMQVMPWENVTILVLMALTVQMIMEH